MNMTQTMRGSVVRIDPEASPVSVIMDLGKRTMTMLMHQQQMYMVRPMPDANEIAAKAEESGRPVHDPDIESTGKTDMILGYTCNQFLVKDGNKVTELWLAPGLGVFAGLGQSGGGGSSPFVRNRSSELAAKWERAFKGRPGYPLRVITHDAAGKETFRMEVTKIAKGGVSDADFTPPAGYKEFQMPDLGGLNPFKH